jgi:hypothetical protein
MPEPFTLAVLGTAALTQGITFLYGQATELLKRRREREHAGVADGLAVPPDVVSPTGDIPMLDGQLRPLPVDHDVIEERAEELLVLTERLGSYANGLREVQPANDELLAQVEALRGLLELAYRQRITFRGEAREPTGSAVDVKILATKVEGALVIADIKQVRDGGRVSVLGELGEVGRNAQVTGYRGDVVGG